MNHREEDIDFNDFRASGWDRPINVSRKIVPNPNRGGSRGYSTDAREHMMANPGQAYACDRTLRRWNANGVNPKRMTGNKVMQKINGNNLYMLVVYRMAFPMANADEIRAFMLRNGCGILFSRQDISRAEIILNLTPKVAATTAMQAFEPHQIVRRQLFWNSPPPIGIRNVPTLELIDCDEAAFGLGAMILCVPKSMGMMLANLIVLEIFKVD